MFTFTIPIFVHIYGWHLFFFRQKLMSLESFVYKKSLHRNQITCFNNVNVLPQWLIFQRDILDSRKHAKRKAL